MMRCPHCESVDTKERRERTTLGYRRFRCHIGKRSFNERTDTSFNHLQYPTDVVCLFPAEAWHSTDRLIECAR